MYKIRNIVKNILIKDATCEVLFLRKSEANSEFKFSAKVGEVLKAYTCQSSLDQLDLRPGFKGLGSALSLRSLAGKSYVF